MAKVTEQMLKDDFKLFVCYVWSLLRLPAPTRVQLLIADFMCDDSRPDRIIEAFRGVGKSYLCYAFVVWKLWNDPTLKFMVVSGASDRADAFSETCQQFIEMVPCLRHLKPTGRDITWTKVKWTVVGAGVSGSASVRSKGINSAMTGGRADYIIADDVETPQNAFTVDQRDKLKTQISEFEAIRKGDEGGGNVSQIIYLGTPQCEESVYNHLADIGFSTRIWPARYPRLEKIDDYRGKLCPVLEDELHEDKGIEWRPTDPARFTEEDLTSREFKYGKAGFSLQFMMDTALSDLERYPLRTSDLLVYTPPATKAPMQLSHGKTRDVTLQDLPRVGFASDKWFRPIFIDNEYKEWEGSVLAIDPSGRGTDETSYVVVKHLAGTLYVTRAGGLQGGYTEEGVLKPLAMIAYEEKVNKVIIESNFGDGMFNYIFKPVLDAIYPVSIEEVRHHINKEMRICDTLEPIMARHKLVVTPDVIQEDYRTSFEAKDSNGKSKQVYSLFYQMTRMMRAKGALYHDDRLDALSIGVAYFTERLARNADVEVGKIKDQRIKDYMKKKLMTRVQQQGGIGSGVYGSRNVGSPLLSNTPLLR